MTMTSSTSLHQNKQFKLDQGLQPCDGNKAAFMRVVLAKVETTAAERTVARTMQADLGVPDDSQELAKPCSQSDLAAGSDWAARHAEEAV